MRDHQAHCRTHGLGWRSEIASTTATAARQALGEAAPLERLILDALRRCPRPRIARSRAPPCVTTKLAAARTDRLGWHSEIASATTALQALGDDLLDALRRCPRPTIARSRAPPCETTNSPAQSIFTTTAAMCHTHARIDAIGNIRARWPVLHAMRARVLVFLAIFLTSAGFDQASKEWARDTLSPHVATPVIQGYWDWQLERNPGAAFSMFAGAGEGALRVGFAVVAVLALIAIGIAAVRTRPEQRLRRVAYALIAGGALGNLIDRIAAGSVTDFVRWHVHQHMWPVFNVADAMLVVGVALVLIESARQRQPRPQPATG